jgi:hypothetical protein
MSDIWSLLGGKQTFPSVQRFRLLACSSSSQTSLVSAPSLCLALCLLFGPAFFLLLTPSVVLFPPIRIEARIADAHAANVLPIIREIRKAGGTTLREIAEALNARGVRGSDGAMLRRQRLGMCWRVCKSSRAAYRLLKPPIVF